MRFVSRPAAMLCVMILVACRPPTIPALPHTSTFTQVASTLTVTSLPTGAQALETPIPTPTDEPLVPNIIQRVGDLTAYSLNNQVCIIREGGEPVYIAENNSVVPVVISPDQELVVYVVRSGNDEAAPIEEIWTVKPDGSNRRLLTMLEAHIAEHPIRGALYGVIGDREWIPGTHLLAFNTVDMSGYGGRTFKDLYILDVDTGTIRTLLPPILEEPNAMGLESIFSSPDGKQIALVDPDSLSLINIDGTDYRPSIFSYESVAWTHWYITIRPTWTVDSAGLWIAVPPTHYFNQLKVWYLPVDGVPLPMSSIDLGSAEANGGWPMLIAAVASPNGEYVIYQHGGNRIAPNAHLYLSNQDGSQREVYFEASRTLGLIDWVDTSHFRFVDSIMATSSETQWLWYMGDVGGDYTRIEEPAIPLTGCAP